MSEVSREDIEAALEVRREQGHQLEPALVDAMAYKIEAAVRRRFEAEVAERQRAEFARQKGNNGQLTLAIVSLVFAIPLTAIAAAFGGLLGIALVWAGIVLINMAFAIRRPPKRQ